MGADMVASYYAWGHYDHGQRYLATVEIEPHHIARFGEMYADAQAALRDGTATSAPGLVTAWQEYTLSDGARIVPVGGL